MSQAIVGSAGRVVTRERELDEECRTDVRHYSSTYSLKCDGTTDDTNAWNEIFTNAPSGAKLVTPPGTSIITAQVTIIKAIDLDARGTIFSFTGTTNDTRALHIGPQDTSALSGGRIRGLTVIKSAKDWTNTVTGIRFRNLTDWVFDDLTIANFKYGHTLYGISQPCSRNHFGYQAVYQNETQLLTSLDATGTCDDNTFVGGDWYYTGSAAATQHLDLVGAVAFPSRWTFIGCVFRAIAGNYTAGGAAPQTGTELAAIDSGCRSISFIGCRALTADTSVMRLLLGGNCVYCNWHGGDGVNLFWSDSAAAANLNQCWTNGQILAQQVQVYGASPSLKLLGSAAGAHALLAGMDESATVGYFDTSSSGTARSIAWRIGGTEKGRFESGRLKLSSSVLGFSPSGTALTVTSNTINPTRSYHLIDTDGGAQTVKTVSAVGAGAGGDLLILQGKHATNDLIFDNTGNLIMPGGTVTLSDNNQAIVFLFCNNLNKYVCLDVQTTNA